jgi:ACR3 family arsenite efflux pump ArsB
LDRDEAQDGDLPPVCIRCGRKAAVWKKKRFTTSSGVAFLLGGPLVAGMTTRTIGAKLPFCRKHKNHWRTLNIVLLCGLIYIPLVGLGIYLAKQGYQVNQTVERIGGIVLGAACFSFVLWLIAILTLNSTTVRAVKVTNDDLTLQGVSDEFVKAMAKKRREDRAERRKW